MTETWTKRKETFNVRVSLYWSETQSESDIASRCDHRELMFTLSSDKNQKRKLAFALSFNQCVWTFRRYGINVPIKLKVRSPVTFPFEATSMLKFQKVSKENLDPFSACVLMCIYVLNLTKTLTVNGRQWSHDAFVRLPPFYAHVW